MAGTQISKVDEFKSLLNTGSTFKTVKAAFGGKEEDAKVFCSEMLDLYGEGGDYLQKCDPRKIIAECLKAAQLNLPIIKSLGYAYIVPFKGVPTFTIGWKGLVQLALNTGKYKYINTDAVYEGQEVKRNYLSGAIEIIGEPESDKAIGYFAYIQLLNGFEKTVYMTTEEIERHAIKYSPQSAKAGKLTGVWKDNFDAMAKKTVLRRVLNFGPKSTAMQKVEDEEIRHVQQSVQAEVSQNANNGDVIDIPQSAVTETPVEENPAPTPSF